MKSDLSPMELSKLVTITLGGIYLPPPTSVCFDDSASSMADHNISLPFHVSMWTYKKALI